MWRRKFAGNLRRSTCPGIHSELVYYHALDATWHLEDDHLAVLKPSQFRVCNCDDALSGVRHLLSQSDTSNTRTLAEMFDGDWKKTTTTYRSPRCTSPSSFLYHPSSARAVGRDTILETSARICLEAATFTLTNASRRPCQG